VRGLTILAGSRDTGRYRTALALAAAQAAAGGGARLYLHEDAVAMLAPPPPADDARYAAAGLPTLAELQEAALGLGVRIVACQSGLALAAIDATSLDPRIETGGMIGMITALDEDRLVIA
jgi:predicted peroxiredoxin